MRPEASKPTRLTRGSAAGVATGVRLRPVAPTVPGSAVVLGGGVVPCSGVVPRAGAAGSTGGSTATVPRLGPATLPPPYANGTPRCESARWITKLIACWWVGSAVARPGAITNNARLIATAKMRFIRTPCLGASSALTSAAPLTTDLFNSQQSLQSLLQHNGRFANSSLLREGFFVVP